MPQNQKKKKQNNNKQSLSRLYKPPQLRSNVVINHTFRYTASGAVVNPILTDIIVASCGAVCITSAAGAATYYAIASSAKIHSIEIWTPPASQGASATCSVEWLTTTNYSSTQEVSDTTVSTSVPAHVIARPPKDSLASFWLNPSTSATACLIVAPTNSIIDLNVSYVLRDGVDKAVYLLTGATVPTPAPTIGGLYYSQIDAVAGVSRGTAVLFPVSLSST